MVYQTIKFMSFHFFDIGLVGLFVEL